MNKEINLGNLIIPVIKPQKGKDYYTESEKQELISIVTDNVNAGVLPQEQTRQSNEIIRQNNEQTRQAQETIRQTNETNRQTAETERESAENTRQSNESSRVSAEQTRTQTFNNKMDEVDTAIAGIHTSQNAYDQNATAKTSAFNENATSKTSDYNTNATNKTAEYNENASTKIAEYDAHIRDYEAELATKVDKVIGKGLSSNDFTNEEKAKLAELHNYDDTELSERVDDIEQEQTTQNTNISTNAINIETLQEENENLKKIVSQLPQVEGQGTSITLENTIEAQFTIFDIEGNSTQETTEGYQLFDIGKSASDYSSNVENSLVITEKSIQMKVLHSGQTITYRTQNLTGNKKYTITGNASLVYSRLYIRMRKNDDSGWLTNSDASIEGWTYNSYYQGWYKENEPKAINQTVTIPECKYWQLGFGFNSLETAVNTTQTISDIMLNEGSTAQPWEKYTNGASPNPNYEQPIYSAGDNENIIDINRTLGTPSNTGYDNTNKRTFDVTTLIKFLTANNYYNAGVQIDYSLTDNGIKITTKQAGYGIGFPVILSSAKTYTISANIDVIDNQMIRAIFYKEDGTYISNVTSSGTNKFLTFTTTNDTYFVVILLTPSANIETTYSEIKLEQGTKATPYSPYGMGRINEKIINKNAWNIDKFKNLYGTNTYETYNNIECLKLAGAPQRYNFDGKENTQYTFQFKLIGSTISSEIGAFSLVYSDGTSDYHSGILTPKTYTFTSKANKTLVRIVWNAWNAGNFIYIDKNSMQLEPGTTATDYVPHEEQDYSIFVQQPMRSIGDVRDCFVKKDGNWYERHYISKVVLDGTEPWSLQNDCFTINISDIKPTPNYEDRRQLITISNYYIAQTSEYRGQILDLRVCKTIDPGNPRQVAIKDTSKTITEFKAMLEEKYASGNPLYVEYLLAEPLDLPCTEEQIQQLENLPSTYKDFTIINSEDETPAYLEVSGIRDINTMFDKVTNAIVSLGGNV